MASERELPSESEESDEDYVPSGEERQLSEEDSDGEPEEGGEGSGVEEVEKTTKKTKKRKGKQKRPGQRSKVARQASPEQTNEEPEEDSKKTEEETKQKEDAIWAAFKADTASITPATSSSVSKSSCSTASSTVTAASAMKSRELPKQPLEAPQTVTKTYEFAGEKVEVVEQVKPPQLSAPITKKLDRGGKTVIRNCGVGIPSRLGSMLGQLGKKNKLSTLEKTKLDWDNYKKQNDISEELQSHNRGKHGYLEKQDFLQRTDLRQFEIEKQLRATTRRSNR